MREYQEVRDEIRATEREAVEVLTRLERLYEESTLHAKTPRDRDRVSARAIGARAAAGAIHYHQTERITTHSLDPLRHKRT